MTFKPRLFFCYPFSIDLNESSDNPLSFFKETLKITFRLLVFDNLRMIKHPSGVLENIYTYPLISIFCLSAINGESTLILTPYSI